jgi:hypothetical protein
MVPTGETSVADDKASDESPSIAPIVGHQTPGVEKHRRKHPSRPTTAEAPFDPEEASDADGYYKVYEEYAKALRTWLVAYGIGGPVLLLTNDSVRTALASSGGSRMLAFAFLAGVGLQVFLAALNKTLMWTNYFAATSPTHRARRRFRVAAWLSEQFWIDLLVDLASLALFGWATWRAFDILTRGA